eukprot:gene11973-5374_t
MSETKIFNLFQPEDYEKNKKEVDEFRKQLNKNGYGYVECTNELKELVKSLRETSSDFFSSQEEKQKFASKNIKESPYNHGKLREMFDVHLNSEHFPNESFQQVSTFALESFMQKSLEYLRYISDTLECDFDYLKSLVGNPKETATSIRFSKYIYKGTISKITCNPHCDSGILTFITCFDEGLNIKKFENNEWIDVEKNSTEKPCLILLVGETLSRATGGYLKAPLHKVITKKERFAITFFLRGNLDKEINFEKTKSKFLKENTNQQDKELFVNCLIKDIDTRTPLKGKTYGYKFKQSIYYEKR